MEHLKPDVACDEARSTQASACNIVNVTPPLPRVKMVIPSIHHASVGFDDFLILLHILNEPHVGALRPWPCENASSHPIVEVKRHGAS